MSVFGHRAKSQKPPIPLISAIVSCHPFNLAEAKSSVRLHPNKPENLHSNGDFDNCGIFSFIHKWWKIVRWKKNSPCSSTSPLRRQKAGTHLRDRYLPCFLNKVVLPTMICKDTKFTDFTTHWLYYLVFKRKKSNREIQGCGFANVRKAKRLRGGKRNRAVRRCWQHGLVPKAGLEPARLLKDIGFWVQRVYQFRHSGISGNRNGKVRYFWRITKYFGKCRLNVTSIFPEIMIFC